MKVVRVDQEVEQIFSNFVIFCVSLVSFIDFGFSNFKYLTKILANHQHKTATITSQFFDVLLDILFGHSPNYRNLKNQQSTNDIHGNI